ncbi:MAG: AMP-binding protein [Promethearchaeota archaeon]
MKDYSDWEPILDYENDSPWVNPNRPWLKYKNAAADPKVPKTIKFEPIPVHELLKLRAREYPNNVCVYYKPKDKKYTYRELVYISDKVANALSQMGIGKGDSVGLYTGNVPEFLFCCLGIMATGASVSPINPLLKKDDVIHIIREAGNINTVFVHKNLYVELKGILLENIILIEAEEALPNTITFEEFIKDKAPRAPDVEINPTKDVAALLFTGGSTGLPKGVMLTHDNLVADALCTIYSNGKPDEEESPIGVEAALSILPLCHSFGFMVFIISLATVIQLIMLNFVPSDVLEAIEYFKIKTFTGVPVMYQLLVNSHDFTERDLSSIESSSCGSAALPKEIANKWKSVVEGPIGQGFGLTETSPITHTASEWMPEIKPESIGVPIIDTDSIIVDTESLEELEPGKVGELWIRGPQVMKGYWKRPEATSETLVKDKDGNIWLRTGDLARMNEQGYFYIAGRSKDMIKYKGYKVMPAEVEEKLFQHPSILEAGVIGVPDPNIGETIKAFVVLQPEKRGNITEREIIEWSKEKMAGYKWPRKVEFLNALPRTAVGKIFRRKLREMEENK